jgi:hypothetical protein
MYHPYVDFYTDPGPAIPASEFNRTAGVVKPTLAYVNPDLITHVRSQMSKLDSWSADRCPPIKKDSKTMSTEGDVELVFDQHFLIPATLLFSRLTGKNYLFDFRKQYVIPDRKRPDCLFGYNKPTGVAREEFQTTVICEMKKRGLLKTGMVFDFDTFLLTYRRDQDERGGHPEFIIWCLDEIWRQNHGELFGTDVEGEKKLTPFGLFCAGVMRELEMSHRPVYDAIMKESAKAERSLRCRRRFRGRKNYNGERESLVRPDRTIRGGRSTSTQHQ